LAAHVTKMSSIRLGGVFFALVAFPSGGRIRARGPHVGTPGVAPPRRGGSIRQDGRALEFASGRWQRAAAALMASVKRRTCVHGCARGRRSYNPSRTRRWCLAARKEGVTSCWPGAMAAPKLSTLLCCVGAYIVEQPLSLQLDGTRSDDGCSGRDRCWPCSGMRMGQSASSRDPQNSNRGV